jgi:hypothetical protein
MVCRDLPISLLSLTTLGRPGRRFGSGGAGKERASSAIDGDQEGVGTHVGVLVDGAFAPPTLDTLGLGPYPPAPTAHAVIYRSRI